MTVHGPSGAPQPLPTPSAQEEVALGQPNTANQEATKNLQDFEKFTKTDNTDGSKTLTQKVEINGQNVNISVTFSKKEFKNLEKQGALQEKVATEAVKVQVAWEAVSSESGITSMFMDGKGNISAYNQDQKVDTYKNFSDIAFKPLDISNSEEALAPIAGAINHAATGAGESTSKEQRVNSKGQEAPAVPSREGRGELSKPVGSGRKLPETPDNRPLPAIPDDNRKLPELPGEKKAPPAIPSRESRGELSSVGSGRKLPETPAARPLPPPPAPERGYSEDDKVLPELPDALGPPPSEAPPLPPEVAEERPLPKLPDAEDDRPLPELPGSLDETSTSSTVDIPLPPPPPPDSQASSAPPPPPPPSFSGTESRKTPRPDPDALQQGAAKLRKIDTEDSKPPVEESKTGKPNADALRQGALNLRKAKPLSEETQTAPTIGGGGAFNASLADKARAAKADTPEEDDSTWDDEPVDTSKLNTPTRSDAPTKPTLKPVTPSTEEGEKVAEQAPPSTPEPLSSNPKGLSPAQLLAEKQEQIRRATQGVADDDEW